MNSSFRIGVRAALAVTAYEVSAIGLEETGRTHSSCAVEAASP
jgi:hypothetical protein